MARTDWYGLIPDAAFQESQGDINEKSQTNLTAEELAKLSHKYSVQKYVNTKSGYYKTEERITELQNEISNLQKPYLSSRGTAVYYNEGLSDDDQKIKELKEEILILQNALKSSSVVIQKPKDSGKTSNGLTYSFSSGASLKNNLKSESFVLTEYNGKYYNMPSDDMVTLTSSKIEEVVNATVEKGEPLSEREITRILGTVNSENKIAWYSYMLDVNADTFGFAANGKPPMIDPKTGQFVYNEDGSLKTDDSRKAVPGEITVSNVDGKISVSYQGGESVSYSYDEKGNLITTTTDSKGNTTTSATTPDGKQIPNYDAVIDYEGEKDETPKDETPKDETPKDETPKDETPKDETPTPPKVTIGENGNLFVDGVDTGYAVSQETPSVGDEVPAINDKGSGIDQFYRQNLDTLNVDPNSQYSNMYKRSMYGAINAQEQMSNATLAQAELDAYKMLGQQQLELENQIASQRMQAIKSGVTSAQLASQQLANIFAAQSGAAQVAQGVLDQRTANASSFAQQRTNVTSDLYNMLQQNQSTSANVNAQMAAAQASYMSYIKQPWEQYAASTNALKNLGPEYYYYLQGGVPGTYSNNNN